MMAMVIVMTTNGDRQSRGCCSDIDCPDYDKNDNNSNIKEDKDNNDDENDDDLVQP